MNTTTLTLMIAALAALACASPTFAQAPDAPARGPMTFADFDRDGNGQVDETEFNAARAQRLGAQAATGAPMRGAASAPSFTDFDLNGDGQMSADEFATVHDSRMRGGSGMGMGMGPGYGRGQGGGMGRGMGMNRPAFGDFDLDGNGTLTEQEFYEARAKRIAERSQQGYAMRGLANAPTFEAIDLNGDGLIDPREFAAAQSQHQQQGFQTQPAAGSTAAPRP